MPTQKQPIKLSHGIMAGLAILLTMLTFPLLANTANPNGITLNTTRVIYPHDAKNGITYTVTNNTTSAYLLQARVVPWVTKPATENHEESNQEAHADESESSGTFIVLPPLQRFEPGETLTLRIRQKHNLLMQDRETLEVLSLTAIPAQANPKSTENTESGQLSLALANNLKLFYRPAGIPEYNIENVEKQLQFSRSKTELIVKNPTPFYVTFSSLQMGKTDVNFGDDRMISPFSEQRWPLNGNHDNNVRWQLINDQGGTHEANSRQLMP